MAALYILIPIAVVIVGFAIWLFFWAVDSGQYEDLDGPAHSILFDDDDPRHQAGVEQADTETGISADPIEEHDPRA
jgi:cbb3-type cytochrome oxidase maturation protein